MCVSPTDYDTARSLEPNMTAEHVADLEDIAQRAAKATPGPWKVDDRRSDPLKNIRVIAGGSHEVCEVSDVHQRDHQGGFRGDHKAADAVDAVGLANADFIAHVRDDVPRLCVEIRRLREDLDAAQTTLEDEEAAHQETLRLWQEAKAANVTLRLRIADLEGTAPP